MKTNGLMVTDKAKVLVIEDDTPTAMMMVFSLSRAGCETEVAATGRKGMELAQENKFDLIALDVDLTDINCFEICRELKQRHLSRHTPVVFISRRLCEEDRRRGFEFGAVDYIAKPFDTADFAPRLLSHVKTVNKPIAVVESTET